jgi:hypothetical protein
MSVGWVALGVGVVGSIMSANAQEDAAQTGADAQIRSTQMATAEQRRQFDAVQQLLSPYVNAGTGALTGQQNLIGLNGFGAQQTAIDGIQNSAQFGAMAQQGESAILQNASATGGLRGGNTQGALAQFRPQLLAQLIDQQYARLGGITTLGQNAAAGVGAAGMQTGDTISGLLQQQGAAEAGAALAGGRAEAGMWNSIGNGVGAFAGMRGFNGLNSSSGAQIGGASGAYGAPTSFGVAPGGTYGSLGSGFYGLGTF